MYQTCLPGTREEKCRTSQSGYPNPPHACNLKLLDQKSGPATEKSGIPDRIFHIVRFACPSKALINCTCAPRTATSSLGLFEEANAELEEIDPFCRHLPEVLLARLAIYHGLKKWDLLAVVAKKLAEWNPKEPGFFVELAYATRRAESIHAAHAILTRAASLHPTDPTIQFNLACYEAQMGSLDRAKAHLKRATEIDAKFRVDGAGEIRIWSRCGTCWPLTEHAWRV